VRAATAFNRILRIPGATIPFGVAFTPKGIVVGLRRRRGKLRCPCGWQTPAMTGRCAAGVIWTWAGRRTRRGGDGRGTRDHHHRVRAELVRQAPARAQEAVNRIAFSPILAKTVATGGDVLASEFKRRIGG